jgi:hypothetical protein
VLRLEPRRGLIEAGDGNQDVVELQTPSLFRAHPGAAGVGVRRPDRLRLA